MENYQDCPQILREFLSYHETIKGQSRRTISEYYLDIRMFLRFIKLMRRELPVNTPLEDIPISDVDLDFVRSVSTYEFFDFLSFLANDRIPEGSHDEPGIGGAEDAEQEVREGRAGVGGRGARCGGPRVAGTTAQRDAADQPDEHRHRGQQKGRQQAHGRIVGAKARWTGRP